MRYLILPLLLLSLQLRAQKEYSKKQYRYSVDYSYNIPMGQFAAGHNNNFFTGLCTPVSGVQFYAGLILPSHFSFGIHFSETGYAADRERFAGQVRNKYSAAGYFTTININNTSYGIGTICAEGSYIFDLKFAEIEPYLLLGVGFDNTESYMPFYSVHQKKQGDNYAADIETTIDRKDIFLPGIGFHASKKIWKIIYGNIGAQYSYGMSGYRLNEVTTDYLGNKSYARQYYTQPISVLQITAGLELRFRVIRHFKHPTGAQK